MNGVFVFSQQTLPIHPEEEEDPRESDGDAQDDETSLVELPGRDVLWWVGRMVRLVLEEDIP